MKTTFAIIQSIETNETYPVEINFRYIYEEHEVLDRILSKESAKFVCWM